MIIPSRNCQYAARTVDDIFSKATGDIEVIVVLDNYWPDPPMKDYPNLTIVHKGQVKGMRHSLNLGVQLAKGKYIGKCDDHCIFGEGFDEILTADMEDDWLVNPSRYSVDVKQWKRLDNGRKAVEYLFITYPYSKDNMYGNGLHGRKWVGENGFGKNMGQDEFYWKENKYRDLPIDDMQTFQGSFWMMAKEKYLSMGMLDEKMSDLMENEPQELGFKSGCRVDVALSIRKRGTLTCISQSGKKINMEGHGNFPMRQCELLGGFRHGIGCTTNGRRRRGQ